MAGRKLRFPKSPDQLEFDFEKQADLIADVAADLLCELGDLTRTEDRRREIEATKRRSALRLVAKPIMGYEHLFLAPPEPDNLAWLEEAFSPNPSHSQF